VNFGIMWVKRTESEMAAERLRQRHSRLQVAMAYGGFITIATAFYYGWSWGRHRFAVPASQIPLCAVLSGVIMTLLYYKFHRERPVMICPKCEVTKYDDNMTECSCGGHFEKLEEMKYQA